MAFQIQTARTHFDLYKKDTSDVSITLFSYWCDYINKYIHRFLVGTDPERFLKTYDLSVTAGTSTYTLPTDFRSVDTYGSGLFYINDDNTSTNRQLPRTSFGSSESGWYINKGTIIITPSPTVTKTYRLRYIPNIASITTYTQYFTDDGTATGNEIIPAEYIENTLKILDIRYTQWDEDPSSEMNADQRLVNALDEFTRNIRRESNNVFLPEFAIDYSDIYSLY